MHLLCKLKKLLSLQQCDLPSMITNVSYMLKVFMINVDSRNTKRCPLIFNIIIGWLAVCNVYTFTISVVWFVFYRCPQLASCDVVTAMINFSLGAGSNTGAPKLIFIALYHNEIKAIIDGYMNCNSLVEPGTRFSYNLFTALRTVKKRIVIVWIVNWLILILYVFVSPAAIYILTHGRHLLEDKQVLLGLEPMMDSPNYELAILLVGISASYIVYVCVCSCTLFLTITGYTEAQMVALSIELTHLWDDAQQNYLEVSETSRNERFPAGKDKILNEYVRHHLIDIIKRHAMNIKLLSEFEYVFRGALLTEFLLMIAGMIAELLGGLESTYLEFAFTFTQAVIDCWTGQLIINASYVFEKAVYNCNWENFDVSNMKMVLLMLQNSQRTMTLSAGGIATLSFACLMSIVKSVFSTFTTLRSTMK